MVVGCGRECGLCLLPFVFVKPHAAADFYRIDYVSLTSDSHSVYATMVAEP